MSEQIRERINLAGVQARWPVHPTTIWRRVREGAFPAPHYIGVNRFWWADEVDEWIAAEIARPRPPRRSAGRPRLAPIPQLTTR